MSNQKTIKESILFTIAFTIIGYLKINLTKKVKNFTLKTTKITEMYNVDEPLKYHAKWKKVDSSITYHFISSL